MQTSAGEIGHHQVGIAILFGVFVDGDDIDMIKLCDDIGLMLKTKQELFMQFTASRNVGKQYFDGDLARKMPLLCQVNGAHTTLSNEFLEHAGAEDSSFQVISIVYHNSPLFFPRCDTKDKQSLLFY